MIKKSIILAIALTLSLSALAQSDRLYLDTDFNFDFDNTEYSGSGLGASETLFGISLAPVLRYEWNEKHSLGAGVNMQKMFGSVRFLDDIDLVAYYQFTGEKYGAVAGLFRREKMIGRYSEAFFSNAWLADNRLVQGLALQYHDEVGFAELVADWNGLYSFETREQFRILFSGEGRFAKVMYVGATAAMQHYANRADFSHNVVDNFTINPYLGVDFKAFFDFDIRLGYLQSLQRDRLTGGGWLAPMGGELFFRMSRWGVFISNNLYVGKNLQPLYNSTGKEGTIYGANLYASDPFYGTTNGIYNRTGIGYERNFWKERIKVKAEFVLKTDGKRLYNQQIISLAVNLAPKLYDKNRRETRDEKKKN
uniref:hypothetical protein n=1 Tax=Alistipes sp. TaxID=1872444 RepID=UPI00405600E9